MDEKVDTTRCGGSHNCQDNERCLTHDLWHDLSDQIYDYLNRISLNDLMERRGVKKVAQRQDEELRRTAEKAAVSADVKFAATAVGTGVRA